MRSLHHKEEAIVWGPCACFNLLISLHVDQTLFGVQQKKLPVVLEGMRTVCQARSI